MAGKHRCRSGGAPDMALMGHVFDWHRAENDVN